MEITLERAKRRDAQQIAELSRDLIEAGLGWTWRPARVEAELRRRDTLGVVARGAAGEVAGFGLMRYLGEEGHLLLFAVVPGARRGGLGGRMLGWLESCAREDGAARLVLEVRSSNRSAQGFYRQAGFEIQRVLVGYYQRARRVEDAVRMVKPLASARVGVWRSPIDWPGGEP